MEFKWYKIFNLTEWLATQLVSRTVTVFLEGIGEKEILIGQGNETSLTFDDVFLVLNFNSENPWQVGDWAIYQDEASDVWLGKAVS